MGTFEAKWAKAKHVVGGITKATGGFSRDGRAAVGFRPEVPTCCIVSIYIDGCSTSELNAARDRVLESDGGQGFQHGERRGPEEEDI